ncbi:prephenate dehydrogenase [Coraliomargarita parva]|uniref:prephenate dehydrogenase n=1 Tax=Coraliomargarita parva TaxID=3014050 RepID=UPI0022B2F33F|nr:prephenate dehydrogenase/arogenate dehydrogenase family protein [Coraliomargarita parva]
MFEQITILGPGLLGASLAMAVKERDLARRIVSWSRRPETRAKCLNQNWCDQVADSPEAAVKGSDCIILCTPVKTIAPLVGQIAPVLEKGALVTDVGSTKSLICRESRSLLANTGARFIGSHPMAGSEQAGMEFARGDLFEQAACLVTPLDDASETEIAKLLQFWEALGMIVSTVSPEKHDEIVAHVSHLPHFLMSSLCSYLASREPNWQNYSGGGLRDSTRIASGDPGLWQQIFTQNREEVVRALDGFERELQALKSALLNGQDLQILNTLERGKAYRDRLRQRD